MVLTYQLSVRAAQQNAQSLNISQHNMFVHWIYSYAQKNDTTHSCLVLDLYNTMYSLITHARSLYVALCIFYTPITVYLTIQLTP